MKCCVYFTVFAYLVSVAYGYSKGAPAEVCDDMTPQHHVDPQKTKFLYTVNPNKNALKAGEKMEITVSGGTFKGFLIQVRNGDKAVGSFNIADTDKYARTIDCHGSKKSAATHKNSVDKTSVKLNWTAPENFKGKLTITATVAENGGVFWVAQKIRDIQIN